MEYDGTVHREKPLEQKKNKKKSIACLCHNAAHQCGQNSEIKIKNKKKIAVFFFLSFWLQKYLKEET